MILQSLTQLFERIQREEDNPYGVPTPGYSVQDVSFMIIVNPDGSLVGILEAPKIEKKLQQFNLPGEGKSTGKITPKSVHKKAGYFWNDLSYMTGIESGDQITFNELKFNAFRDNHVKLEQEIEDPHITAVTTFLKNWTAEKALAIADQITSFTKTGYGVFRVNDGTNQFLHDRSASRDWLAKRKDSNAEASSEGKQQCLVTGKFVPTREIARIHQPKIKGVGKNRTLLVSFEGDAYRSYSKDQSYNAPVSESAVFAYCNALNALLSGPQSHRHRVTIGDVTAIFWTEKKTTTESLFAQVLDGNLKTQSGSITTEDQTYHRHLQSLINILRRGGGASLSELEDDPDTKFYLLGLSGNVTRLVVRFWHVSTVGQMLENLKDHYQNLALARKEDANPFWEPEFPSAQRILEETARNRDRKAIAPLLGGQLMKAILHRSPYPHTLLQGILNRLKVVEKDQQGKTIERVSYLKATILKAILIRNFNQTIPIMLDTDIEQTPYLLGRLFAVMEQAQRQANEFKLDRTIRETFFGSACSTPASVFPRIHKLHIHHLRKVGRGSQKFYEDLIGEIVSKLEKSEAGEITYPKTLKLEEQGAFAIGYYQQNSAFKKKKELIPADVATTP